MVGDKENRGCCGQEGGCCCCRVEWAMWGNMNALYAAASEESIVILYLDVSTLVPVRDES